MSKTPRVYLITFSSLLLINLIVALKFESISEKTFLSLILTVLLTYCMMMAFWYSEWTQKNNDRY